jgi:hypothetical protein
MASELLPQTSLKCKEMPEKVKRMVEKDLEQKLHSKLEEATRKGEQEKGDLKKAEEEKRSKNKKGVQITLPGSPGEESVKSGGEESGGAEGGGGKKIRSKSALFKMHKNLLASSRAGDRKALESGAETSPKPGGEKKGLSPLGGLGAAAKVRPTASANEVLRGTMRLTLHRSSCRR